MFLYDWHSTCGVCPVASLMALLMISKSYTSPNGKIPASQTISLTLKTHNIIELSIVTIS